MKAVWFGIREFMNTLGEEKAAEGKKAEAYISKRL